MLHCKARKPAHFRTQNRENAKIALTIFHTIEVNNSCYMLFNLGNTFPDNHDHVFAQPIRDFLIYNRKQ